MDIMKNLQALAYRPVTSQTPHLSIGIRKQADGYKVKRYTLSADYVMKDSSGINRKLVRFITYQDWDSARLEETVANEIAVYRRLYGDRSADTD